jgi:ATPase family associated with various cellular activities (AAA)
MGFLSSSDLIECSASDLVGQYVGQTGPKTKKLFEKALGKVLFVDEAYRLSQGHFAQEAIDEVVGLMTNERFMNKMVIIFAGYEKEMNTLLGVNPGLASRLSEEIILNNMPAAKCLQVLDKELRKMPIILSELADTTSSSYSEMESIVERMSRLSNWGNARDIKAIAQKLIHHAFGAVANTPGTAVSLSADEAIVIMQDALNLQRERLGVPRMAAVPPSSTLPMASSSNSAPPPPPSKSGSSSATNGYQPPKPPGHNNRSSNQSPPTLPRSPNPAASKPPTKPPSHNSGSSSKTWRKSLPPPPSITSPVVNTTSQLPHRSQKSNLNGSQNQASSSSTSRSPASTPAQSQSSTPSIPDQHGKGKQSPAQRTTGHQAVVRRDPGVKDGVWKQLELDKSRAQAAEKKATENINSHDGALSKAAARQKAAEAELEARDLALKRARDQVEQEELERKREAARIRVEREAAERARVAAEFKRIRLEQETKKLEEENMQRKLRNLGVCSQGFPWIKQVYGYRCAGGAHFVSDSQLG